MSNYERNYGNPPESFDPSRPAFQSRSRSIIGTNIDRSDTYDFPLVFHGHGRINH